MYTVETRELKVEPGRVFLYDFFEKIIPVSAIDYADTNKIACEACHKFGKNFACPPFSPGFQEYVGSRQNAKIICVRLPQEYFRNLHQEEIYRACFRQAREILVNELLANRANGYLVGGCGYCSTCDICGAEQGAEACIHPEKMIYSLESMGVNITDLTKTCFNFDLEWNAHTFAADFVCAIGAVFVDGLEAAHKQP